MTGATRAEGTVGLQEAAEILGVHYMTVYRYVRTGRLAAEQDGHTWRVRIEDLDTVSVGRGADHPRSAARAASAGHLLDRLVAGDEAGAWRVVEDALASGAHAADIHLTLLVPAMREVGRRWSRGELDVADEHLASATTRRLIARLGPRFARPGRKRGTVLVGAVAGERHEIPVAIVADQLRGAGFHVIELGGDTPVDSFADAAERERPLCVMIAVTTADHEVAVTDTVARLRERTDTIVLVGGAAVTDELVARRLGSDHWTGRDARDVVALVERLRAQHRR